MQIKPQVDNEWFRGFVTFPQTEKVSTCLLSTTTKLDLLRVPAIISDLCLYKCTQIIHSSIVH